uniref:Uncharacterized protein n=1 Tax=Anopheles maculatus TaxID=74869 RepID=A0A182S7L1_9DIPT
MDFKFVISVLLAIPASPYEFSCFYEWCTLSNIDLTIDGLYPFTIIPNDTDTLILKGATGKRLNLTLLQNTPLLTLIVLANSKLEDIVVHQLKTPSSLVLRHVSLKQIHFHPSDNTLEHIRLCGVPFSVIPQSVLQLQHLVELEQCRSPLRNLRLSDLRNLHSLVNLNLSYNKIRTSSTSISTSHHQPRRPIARNLSGMRRWFAGALSSPADLPCFSSVTPTRDCGLSTFGRYAFTLSSGTRFVEPAFLGFGTSSS